MNGDKGMDKDPIAMASLVCGVLGIALLLCLVSGHAPDILTGAIALALLIISLVAGIVGWQSWQGKLGILLVLVATAGAVLFPTLA